MYPTKEESKNFQHPTGSQPSIDTDPGSNPDGFHSQPTTTPPSHTPNPNPPGHPPIPRQSGRQEAIEKVEQVTMFTYFGIAALLMFRFVLSLFAASRATPFVDFVFQLTTPFMVPFASMFGGPIGPGNNQLEFEVLVAILVYGLVFFGLARLIRIIFK